jgi:1-acyl-sn-glycerol-3-phosphate acyltransferase
MARQTARDPRKRSPERQGSKAENKAGDKARKATTKAGTATEAIEATQASATRGTKESLLPVPIDPHPPDDPRRSDVDEWGRSEHLRSILRTVVDPIYTHWFRAEWENFDRIPTEGGALLVGNHAGAIPSDAATIMHGIETQLGRPVYTLADEFFKKLPLVNIYWQRLGGVQAHPDNAYRLLREQRQLVLTFPEGNKGPGKHFSERYQLRRFGRGGFVEIALRAGVPIIPIATVGAEESMPIVYKSPTLARLLGLPYFPITANMLVLGPLGIVTWFPAKFRMRVLEPITFDEPPDQPRYSRSRIMDSAEMIRQRIQEALYDMLRQRQSVWRG